MRTLNLIFLFRLEFLILLLALFVMRPAHAEFAGRVLFSNGKVQIISADGRSQEVKKGDPIQESDTVATAKDASAQLRMQDGGLIAMRPDTQFKVESFKYDGKEDGSEHSFFALLKGGIRAITGMIGHEHKQNYRIAALSTTIGIRGTDHETWVVLPGSELAKTYAPGTYNKVNKGETTMTTSQGTINILPNEMGYSASDSQLPQLQPVNARLFTVAAAPTAGSGKQFASVRSSTVQDNTVLNSDIVQGNLLPGNPQLNPIKGKTSPTAPGQVF